MFSTFCLKIKNVFTKNQKSGSQLQFVDLEGRKFETTKIVYFYFFKEKVLQRQPIVDVDDAVVIGVVGASSVGVIGVVGFVLLLLVVVLLMRVCT